MDGKLNDTRIVEYRFTDGQWTFKDSEMMVFYRDMAGIEDTFYNVEDTSKIDPLPYFKRVRFFLGYHKEVPTGAIWISGWNPLNQTGFFNFSWFKSSTLDPFKKLTVCRTGMRIILSMPEFQLLYAETSVSNRKTLALAKYFGFEAVGMIPHAHWNAKEHRFEDTIFMYIDKDLLR